MALPEDIFDRAARRRARDCVMRAASADRWLLTRMADELIARLNAVRTPFAKALLIGGDYTVIGGQLSTRGLSVSVADPGLAAARSARGVQCDEDRLPFADASFDLVIAIGTLDTVNDLPGALTLIRRVLRSDGLFLGAMAGGGSLPALRGTMPPAGGVARFHPQIDVRGAGDLLGRAGFSMPVADAETVDARYRNLQRLTTDLRANGLRNVLSRREALSRKQIAEANAAFAEAATQGRTVERFSIVYLTGWAPAAKAIFRADR